MHNVEYGGNDIKDSGIGYAILDTGTSLLYLGTEDYNNFVDYLLGAVPDLDCDSNIYCFSDKRTCEEITPLMQPLSITLQENTYTLPPEAYTFPQQNVMYPLCTIAVSYTDKSGGVYILGDTFLRNFVTTFDFASGEMQLTVNVNAPAGITIEYNMSGWKIFGIVAGCILAVIIIIFITCYCVKKRKQDRLAKGYQTIGSSVEHEGEISQEPLTRGDQNNADTAYKNHWGQ
jgi:hypothetical protein